jgi:hypothetical protein
MGGAGEGEHDGKGERASGERHEGLQLRRRMLNENDSQ